MTLRHAAELRRGATGQFALITAACGGLLALASLALPWSGWLGLLTVGPGIAFVGAIALGIAATGLSPHADKLAAAVGAAGTALIVLRLASPPGGSFARSAWSPRWLAVGLVGAILVTLGALAEIRRNGHAGRYPRAVVLSAEQRAAFSSAWRATLVSRLLVWAAGVLGVLTLGLEPTITKLPALGPFSYLGNVLTAPATPWDAGGYVTIAQYGYTHGEYFQAFFPVYPVLVRSFAFSVQAAVLVGIAVSVIALLVSLYLLHRLVSLECGGEVADLSVWLLAFAPMALFFSAVYSESVFLALTVGAFYAARRGWWARAGIAGGFAAATRVSGSVLLVPLAVLYLYGPRGRGMPPAPLRVHSRLQRLRPRFRVRADGAYLLLVPLGAFAFLLYSGAHGDLLAPLHSVQTYWHRRFVPLLGAFRGFLDAIRSVGQIASGPSAHVLHLPSVTVAGQLAEPSRLAAVDLTDFAFLVFGCVATIGALRRLPAAYGIYAAAVIAVTVSTFTPYEPLSSFPRYLVVVFPCWIWLALWARSGARRYPVLLISAGLLGFFASQFATWRWVA